MSNTSFNVRGEPIVRSPDNAYQCFMRTEMDHLVLGEHLLDKRDRPAWTEDARWQEDYVSSTEAQGRERNRAVSDRSPSGRNTV